MGRNDEQPHITIEPGWISVFMPPEGRFRLSPEGARQLANDLVVAALEVERQLKGKTTGTWRPDRRKQPRH
jgi:hypothetical protein